MMLLQANPPIQVDVYANFVSRDLVIGLTLLLGMLCAWAFIVGSKGL
jgi:hypothetical protein